MEIAVTTSTGNVGRKVVAMLVRAGLRPRVLNPELRHTRFERTDDGRWAYLVPKPSLIQTAVK